MIEFNPMEERSQLKQQLEALRSQVAALDAREPRDMESEAYELWAEEHEDLEDAIDEILDRLEELE